MAGAGRGWTYMPTCQCGTHLTDLRTFEEQMRWAERLGGSWDWNENGRADWFYCLGCHRLLWPNDKRINNRYSRPAPKWLHMCVPMALANRRLVGGDLLKEAKSSFCLHNACTSYREIPQRCACLIERLLTSHARLICKYSRLCMSC